MTFDSVKGADKLCEVIRDDPASGELCNMCKADSICKAKEKSADQLEYILSNTNNSIYLKACPGSGKTEVVGLKAAYDFDSWSSPHGGIAILTFTKNAADIIRDRINKFLPHKSTIFPHYVGTIDSWIHGYIAHPFLNTETGYVSKNGDNSFKLISESESPAKDSKQFLYGYQSKTPYVFKSPGSRLGYLPIYANTIRNTSKWEFLKPGASRSDFITSEDYFTSPGFEEYRNTPSKGGGDKSWIKKSTVSESLEKAKKKFNKDGYATYHDVERLTLKVLCTNKNILSRLSNRFPLIIIDECQDLSLEQLKLLKLLKDQGSAIHFVGDLDQAIYDFKKVYPKEIDKFAIDNKLSSMTLTNNFRSCQSIVDLCDNILSRGNSTTASYSGIIDSPCICLTYDKNDINKLPGWFFDYVTKHGINHSEAKIVARGWATIGRLRPTGKIKNTTTPFILAASILLWKEGGHQSKIESIEQIGKFISQTYFKGCAISYGDNYRPLEIISPVEWRTFLASVMNTCFGNDSISNLDVSWKEWAASVRSKLTVIVTECFLLINIENDLKPYSLPLEVSFKAPNGESKNIVSNSIEFPNRATNHIKITTIHDVKGETLSALMLVSSLTKQGTTDGHWDQWLSDPNSEAARLAYVASSRPKDLLVWAIPTPSQIDEERIRTLGFNIEKLE